MEVTALDISKVTSGWEFVNMFWDRRAGVFYCRIRKIEPEKNQNDWDGVTDKGATMQMAFNNANELAGRT